MILFFTEKIVDDTAYLTGDEYRHCTKALRKRVGDKLTLTDGQGGMMESMIVDITKTEVVLKVTDTQALPKPSCGLHLAISPTKNASRLEWFVEKATEIGVQTITPMLCARTERPRIKMERLRKILHSAATQSLKYHFPILRELTPYEELIRNIEWPAYIAHYDEKNGHISTMIPKGENAMILIGPEGDFTQEEVMAAKEASAQFVNLSPYRLRTETAGIVACQAFHWVNQ